MSRMRVGDGETPLLCGCHNTAVMVTIDQDGAFIFRREWHGDDHMLVLSEKQVLDILARFSNNKERVQV